MGEPETSSNATPLAFINDKGFLTFAVSRNATSDQKILAADIMGLDHRAHHKLRPNTPEWEEVLRMLQNAANAGLVWREVSQGRLFYDRAESSYYRHIETKNRVKYLLGVLLGVVFATLVTTLLYLIARSLAKPFIGPQLLLLLSLFAGIGSLTSVLTRLKSIDLKLESSTQLILVSGIARPVVAVFFALVVYLILDLKVLDIEVGSPTNVNEDSIYFISSFLSGFSERFAQDIFSRVLPIAPDKN